MCATPQFKTTLWSEILRAKARSPGAVNDLFGRYRAPVCGYLLAHGFQEADADDLTQQVFQRILEHDLLRRVDRERGRFRKLLLGITRNIVREATERKRTLKRGRAPLSLDAEAAGGGRLQDQLAAPEPDARFDRLWIANLLDQALHVEELDDSLRNTPQIELLRRRVFEEASHEELAASFGLKPQDVKNHLHRARKRVANRIWLLVREYSSTRDEYEEEVRLVTRLTEGLI
ncbi:MAG: sigma-70 family RNA polymerase sigma factor [Planctomycetes bacterium]|nr:sigma-70 family RNA polymerase sigma factor [Planctomycetota bacterium]